MFQPTTEIHTIDNLYVQLESELEKSRQPDVSQFQLKLFSL